MGRDDVQTKDLVELPDGVINLVLPHDELDTIETCDWDGVGHDLGHSNCYCGKAAGLRAAGGLGRCETTTTWSASSAATRLPAAPAIGRDQALAVSITRVAGSSTPTASNHPKKTSASA
jgi:hypothetical protein